MWRFYIWQKKVTCSCKGISTHCIQWMNIIEPLQKYGNLFFSLPLDGFSSDKNLLVTTPYLITKPLKQQYTAYYWLLDSFFSLSYQSIITKVTLWSCLLPQVDVWALGVSAIEMAEVDSILWFFLLWYNFLFYVMTCYCFHISFVSLTVGHATKIHCASNESTCKCFSMLVSFCS